MRRTDEPMWDRMLREHGEKKAKRALEKELGADARDQSAARIRQGAIVQNDPFRRGSGNLSI